MSDITITVVSNLFGAIKAQLKQDLADIVQDTAMGIEADWKWRMSEPKSGIVYKRKGRTHQASAPGEAPAMDTGNYANSIQVHRISDMEAEVGTSVDYAAILEFVKNRPAMIPAAEKAEKQFLKDVKDLLG